MQYSNTCTMVKNDAENYNEKFPQITGLCDSVDFMESMVSVQHEKKRFHV